MYFIVRWGVIKNEQKKKTNKKNNHYKKKDEGVKGGWAYKMGVVMTLTQKVTHWHNKNIRTYINIILAWQKGQFVWLRIILQ